MKADTVLSAPGKTRVAIQQEMLSSLKNEILDRWYPLVFDQDAGGYFTNVNNKWELTRRQEKMIVSQARHIWTLSKAAQFFSDSELYHDGAVHGFPFLQDQMWDSEFGGFFQVRDREGGLSDVEGWMEEKRTYGNAFAIYAMAALYHLTHDIKVLDQAKHAFFWLEAHAFDPVYKGYFQFMIRNGMVFDRNSEHKSLASDEPEVGFKDQNSSIHMMEAYTELYSVWESPLLREKLEGLLHLIRDIQTHKKGYLQLFFQPDWTPVSFRNASMEEQKKNYRLDHVSFGHDYETAFLMLEASYVLGIENDVKTLTIAKKMVDHAIANGWDQETGGFFDGGYYFTEDGPCTIIKDTKNWWAQAEGLNILLMMSKIFPENPVYYEKFVQLWEYVSNYILDPVNGDWYEGGLDKEPHLATGPKSHIWKCTYHTGRALMNCITMLSEETDFPNTSLGGLPKLREESKKFIAHWKKTAGIL
ncbi:MAG: AGE family epimerase/isomerase [Bacteroidetes bacterium]|nr:AGE family epimerase/isomerase [Bacteroidota bacterium]